MAVNNSLVKKSNSKLSIGTYLTGDAIKQRINQVVGGKDGQKFISAVVSAVNTNPALQECTNQSILSAALLGESLKLSPSPQLGHYYLVPYNDKERGKIAEFQMGYKGYIQLAIRSGQYKKINVMAIKQGELEYFDPLNEDIKVNLMVNDWDAREAAPTVGYYAFFELLNGFRKCMYWSASQMMNHAKTYSPGYRKDLEKGTSYTFWSKNFEQMAFKTMIRQLLNKWGILSIEMENAYEHDMAYIDEEGKANYIENDEVIYEETISASDIEENKHSGAAEVEVVPASGPEPSDAVQTALFGGEDY